MSDENTISHPTAKTSGPKSAYDVSAVPSHYGVPTPDYDAIKNVIRLDSNEAAFGASRQALAAYANYADLHRYPNISAKSLRETIANHYGLDRDRIIVGAGSGEMIYDLGQAYLRPGDQVIYSQHTFSIYDVITHLNGATPVLVPESNYTADADAMVNAITSDTRMLCLSNPDNPTGTYLNESNVRRIQSKLPADAILVHDEAYSQFATQSDFPDGLKLVDEFDNLVVTRTFSKFFGLAALRLGWAYVAPAVADILHRYKAPFNVSAPSEAAAVAALFDVEFADRAVQNNTLWRKTLTGAFSRLGLEVPESAANYIMLLFPEDPGRSAAEAQKFLLSQNIFLRPLTHWGIPNGIRMTIGTKEENETVLAALTEFLTGRKLEEHSDSAKKPTNF